jgi:CBS domain-containing protein
MAAGPGGGRRLPLSERVQEIMRRDFVTIEVGARVDEALVLMRFARLRHLVVARGGRLAGLLSYRDLQDREIEGLRRAAPDAAAFRGAPVEDAMRASPFAVTPDTLLAAAALQMAQLRIGCLPVVEHDAGGARLVGLLTESDLLLAAYG